MSENLAAPAVPPAPPVEPRGPRKAIAASVLWPVVSFAVLLAGWQLLVPLFEVPEYILPVPTEFFTKLVAARALIWQHTLVTSNEILLGFLMATIISVPLGFLIVQVQFLERAFYPLIVFFQLVPKIAVAPLFIVWFGFGLFPKVLFTFLLCFFPTLVASMAGFRALDERVLFLTRSMGASWWQTFRYIRLPAAMGYIFSGLKVSIVFSATGAIVAEFVGANSGLGYLLLRGTSYLDMPLIFAILVALSVVGIFFSYAVQLLENLLMPWQRKS
jgi:NitT/TauT family transport system permease protein